MAQGRKTITALRACGTSRVVEIELDGVLWRRLPAEAVVACALKPGLELDRPRLRRLRAELRRVEALGLAGRLLRHRDLSADRLEGELARRGVAPPECRNALSFLTGAGLVDDRRLAVAQADSLAERGYGDEAIRRRLEQAGLGSDLVEEALASLDSELVRARRLVEERGATARTFRLLARHGFGEDALEGAGPSEPGRRDDV